MTFQQLNSSSATPRAWLDARVQERIDKIGPEADRGITDTQRLLELVETTRMQLLAAALPTDFSGEMAVEERITQIGVVGALVRDEGLTSARVGERHLVLVLPNGSAELDENPASLVAALHRAAERTPVECDWIVDFSAVTSLPNPVWGALLACENRLNFRNRKVRIVFLKGEMVPANWFDRLRRIFQLKEIGGQFFSRA